MPKSAELLQIGQRAPTAKHGLHGFLNAPAASATAPQSRRTCALAPPNPNELTPTIRAPPVAGKGSSVVGTRSFSAAKSMFGLGVSKCRLAGIRRCFRTNSALTRPATPAAVSRWPRFVFTDPISSGASCRTIFAKCLRECMCFDRVTHRGAGSVGFDKSDLRRSNAGVQHRHRAPAEPALPRWEARSRSCGHPG